MTETVNVIIPMHQFVGTIFMWTFAAVLIGLGLTLDRFAALMMVGTGIIMIMVWFVGMGFVNLDPCSALVCEVSDK